MTTYYFSSTVFFKATVGTINKKLEKQKKVKNKAQTRICIRRNTITTVPLQTSLTLNDCCIDRFFKEFFTRSTVFSLFKGFYLRSRLNCLVGERETETVKSDDSSI